MRAIFIITLLFTAMNLVAIAKPEQKTHLSETTVENLFQKILTFHDRDIGGDDTLVFEREGKFWRCTRTNSFPGGIVMVDIRDADGAYRIHGPFFEERFGMSPRLRRPLRKIIEQAEQGVGGNPLPRRVSEIEP